MTAPATPSAPVSAVPPPRVAPRPAAATPAVAPSPPHPDANADANARRAFPDTVLLKEEVHSETLGAIKKLVLDSARGARTELDNRLPTGVKPSNLQIRALIEERVDTGVTQRLRAAIVDELVSEF